ncbi:MAG: AAA family ATPase [Deltaproteobacteria bacterium]|nr:AAA family ATPase [Deltaproteobacteria bacterium]
MLLGRDGELAAIESRLDAIRGGSGSALVILGEAGLGKTALLCCSRARAADLRVLEVCGTETETHLPYAALLQLLEPILACRDSLPAPQTAALEGALALAPSAPGDRFTVCVATLGLLRAAAARQPLLVLVDDAQWLDAASAECVVFAARRLADTPVALIVAVRDDEGMPLGMESLASLRLAPLAPGDAHTLVSAAAADLTASVRDAVVACADGNPLALVEIASSLVPAQRSGRAPLPEPLPAAGRVAAVFDRRLRALAKPVREVLLLAAAAHGGDLAMLRRACEGAGLDERGFEEAEAAGFVHLVDGRLRFAHPLLRSAAYHGVSPPRRRAAHRALARVAEGTRRAWHLAAAATGPDEAAATALAEAAARAAARRGYAEASAAYERAATLTEDNEQRARRLLRACNSRVAAGQMENALALLDQCVALGASVSFSGRTLHTRALLLMGLGKVDTGLELLRSLADAAATTVDAASAAFVTADAAMAALLVGDLRELLVLGRRASELLAGQGDALVKAQVGACLSAGLIFRGHVADGRKVLEEVERCVLDVHDQELALRTHSIITHLRTALEDFEGAHAHAMAVLESLERISAHAARCAPLGHAADAAQRLGHWDLADKQATETIMIAEETANGDALPRALIVRARLAAARGEETSARAAIERAESLIAGHGNITMECYVATARGFLELSLGRAEQAIACLKNAEVLVVERTGLIHPTILAWRPDLVEAYVMTGRLDEAAAVADGLDVEARQFGGAAGLALSARCAGLLAVQDWDRHFQRSLEFQDTRPMPFERARTLLLYGGRLHRSRRRHEARAMLREAEEIFASLGAVPWRERASAELRAAGAKRRQPSVVRSGALTAQELRVAAAVARGSTLREVASNLFLSPKTVDSHLRQVYAKLDIHSRAKLALVAAERGWLD